MRQTFAVFVVFGADAVNAGVVFGVLRVNLIVAGARDVQQLGAHGDVFECARPGVSHHAPRGGEHFAAGRFAPVDSGSEPVQILIAVVVIVEERRAKAEIVGAQAGWHNLRWVYQRGVERVGRHKRAGRYGYRGGCVVEQPDGAYRRFASAVVSQQVV